MLGKLWLHAGRRTRARREFEHAVDCGNSEFSARIALCRIELSEGNVGRAEEQIRRARACDPERFLRLEAPLRDAWALLAPSCGDGALWIGTNQGLVRLRPGRPRAEGLRLFTARGGTGNTEFNRHASLKCGDGTMVFGGMDGLTVFHPDAIRDNPFVPPIRLTGISVSSRAGTRTIEPGSVDRLTLQPGDTSIAFQFAALSFTSPRRNRYAYRMEGFDPGWIDAGHRRTTRYTNLPPGRLRFRVKGSNNDGVWNEDGTFVDLVVLPTLWQTWWLRPTLISLALAAGWAVLRYREHKKREVERLRMRIAGDLHDDLSSDLSGIAVVADMMCGANDIGPGARADLGSIRDASLRMADGLRDIVWYIDPDHDSLRSTVRRMRQVAATLLRGVEHSVHADLPDGDWTLSVTARRSVFLIFKEAVHNALRHAAASKVTISIAVTGDLLGLEISDDGVGFDATAADAGHGVGSMRRRAEEVGGRLDIDSAVGQGTTIRLRLQMAGSRDGPRASDGRIVETRRKEQP
jgi:signal transduction histidine kinase